jgi:hypothetical protein
MSSPVSDSSSAGSRVPYPQIDDAAQAEINQKLIEIISLLHPEGLSEAQLREVSANIAIQTATTEKLHRFFLGNADEPAFFIQLHSGVRDD